MVNQHINITVYVTPLAWQKKKNKITSIFYGNTTTHFKEINLPQLNKIIINLNCEQMKVYLKIPTLKTEIN